MNFFYKYSRVKLVVLGLMWLLALPVSARQDVASSNVSSSSALQKNNSHNPLTLFLAQFKPKQGHYVLQVGGFTARQGTAQRIGAFGNLAGNDYTVTDHTDSNILLGLGYYIDGLARGHYSLLYGINAFYLAQTVVKGNAIQEQMPIFTNFSYRYFITNYPIYIATKALINTGSDKYNLTFDLGIGPNIINTNKYSESSLDDGVTQEDHSFSDNTSVAFSATAGIGIKFNNLLKYNIPLEIGYRFFYLGQGNLNKQNNQQKNSLKTGNSYANAFIVSIDI
jgi:hypothetical protein